VRLPASLAGIHVLLLRRRLGVDAPSDRLGDELPEEFVGAQCEWHLVRGSADLDARMCSLEQLTCILNHPLKVHPPEWSVPFSHVADILQLEWRLSIVTDQDQL
jgi:hypothetical protein